MPLKLLADFDLNLDFGTLKDRESAFGIESFGLNLLSDVEPNLLLDSHLFGLLDLLGFDEVH